MPCLDLNFFGEGTVYVPPNKKLITPYSIDSRGEYTNIGQAIEHTTVDSAHMLCPPRILSVFTRLTFKNLQNRIHPFWARYVSVWIQYKGYHGWTARLSVFESDGCTVWAEPLEDPNPCHPFSSIMIACGARGQNVQHITVTLLVTQALPEYRAVLENIPFKKTLQL